EVATGLAPEYPDVELRHVLADTAGLLLAQDPSQFDVIVMENTFGDILSDVAAGVTGGLGLAASASLGDSGPGIFEPVHGSAPDIAGTRKANPAGMLRSLALALEHGVGEPALARAGEAAVAETHDLLYEAPLSIISEVTLPIVHCLVAKAPIQVSEVRTLRSNSVAFDQCREFVHASGARLLPASTTAEAAREVAESDDA